MTAEQNQRKQREQDHQGRYIAIAPDGKTVVGDSVLEVAGRAKEEFGPGSFLFKLGPKVVYTIR